MTIEQVGEKIIKLVEDELRKDDGLLLRVLRGHWEEIIPIVIALFPDGCTNCDTPLLREGELYQKIEAAKREERERIFREVELRMYNDSPLMIMPGDWQSLKGEK